MNGAGGKENMNPGVGVTFESLTRAVDIGKVAAGQTTNGGAVHLFGNRLNSFKVAWAGDGKTCLDDIDTEFFQGVGDLKLLGQVHAGPGRLFAIAECGVKNENAASAGFGSCGGLAAHVFSGPVDLQPRARNGKHRIHAPWERDGIQ